MPDWFWLVVSPLFLAGLAYYWWYTKKQVERKHSRHAAERGWRYSSSDSTYVRRFSGSPFERGKWRRARHVLKGEYRGRPVAAFEYSYRMDESVNRGKSEQTRTYRYQVVVVELPAQLPALTVGKRGVFGRAERAIGLSATEIGDDSFDRKFSVDAKDNAAARAVLTDDVRFWLLSDDRAERNPVRLHGNEAMTWRESSLDVADVQKRANYLNDLIDRLPAEYMR